MTAFGQKQTYQREVDIDLDAPSFARKVMKTVAKVFGWLVSLCVSTVAVILGLLWLQHSVAVTLPAPSGPYQVGRTEYDWVDQTRIDTLAPHAGTKRELVVWIWYPAATANSSVSTVEYLPAPWIAALDQRAGLLLSDFITRDLSRVHPHAIGDATVSADQRTYPVLLMKPGIGALATDYTTIAEDLASHGYIVVASNSTYSTSVVVFPDGRVAMRTPAGNPGEDARPEELTGKLNRLISVWSEDDAFVLDQLSWLNTSDPSGRFTGRLELRAVGAFGHSFGGATAAEFCHKDSRCKAGIDIDGAPYGDVVQAGIDKPFMFFMSEHRGEQDTVSKQIQANIQAISHHLPNSQNLLTLVGARHFNFSDQALLKERVLSKMLGAVGPIDPRRALVVTAAYIRAFFDTTLKDHPDPLLKGPSPDYPEIQFGSR